MSQNFNLKPLTGTPIVVTRPLNAMPMTIKPSQWFLEYSAAHVAKYNPKPVPRPASTYEVVCVAGMPPLEEIEN